MAFNPDAMDRADVPPFWATFNEDGGYTLSVDEGEGDETEMREVRTEEGWLHGVLTEVRENVGPNDSRVYRLYNDTIERPVLFWGKTHIDRQLDGIPLEVPFYIAIQRTGGSIDVGQPSDMVEYDVRYSDSPPD